MSLNYVTLTLDLYDGQGNYPVSGSASFTPSAVLTDAGVEIIGQQPITAVFHAAGPPTVKLLATDNSAPAPSGWTWGVTFSGITGAPAGFSFFLTALAVSFTATNASPCVFTVGSGSAPANGTGVQLSGGSLPTGFAAATTYYVVAASGATFELAASIGGTAIASTGSGSGTVTVVSQLLSNLISVSSGTAFQAYMPLPTGTASSGMVPVASGSGNASNWDTLSSAGIMPQVMTTLGDTVYGGASGAVTRLAGDTSNTRKFLREQSSGGVAAAPAWDTLQAGDIPQLADYAPAGLTGATAASRYAGATASGAPGSGTFTVGDFVIDQTGKLWICTTAGTPGTWTQVSGATITASDSSVTVAGTAQAPTVGSVPGQLAQRMLCV